MSDADRAVLDWIGKADWGDVPTWITGLVAIVALVYASMQVRGMREQNESAKSQEKTQIMLEADRLRPVVVAYFEPHRDSREWIEFVIKNVGAGVAYNVSFEFDPYPVMSASVRDEEFWKAKFLQDGVNLLAPGQEIRCAADEANERGSMDWPDGTCSVTASYKSIAEIPYETVSTPDMNLLKGSYQHVTKTVHHVAKEMEAIRKKLNGPSST